MSIRNLKLVTGLPFNVPDIVDITDQLPRKGPWETLKNKQNIVRGVWDGTYHTGLRRPEDVDTIVIHHSGPPEGTLKSHAEYHAKQWGAGISYHISIDEGLIKQCNDLLSFTFHVSGNNTYTVGIEINADLSKRAITDRERELLYAAILSVKAVLPITRILGHNELNATACPCTSMDQIRSDIAAIEERMKAKDDIAVLRQKMYRATEQHKYLYNQYAADPANNKWLENYLLRMYEVTKDMGMFFDS
ncbi:peptidoglycan recognition protein family protein [Gorillibacterium sp. sgz5001074]|uniref:peptidoglycan recognition protein family protein n=1 Tax=Gorillibacterium sp. sgz5001074 TaxID=3446695 RepID=UPI003F661CEA